MYTVNKSVDLPETLISYLNHDFVKNIGFDSDRKRYFYTDKGNKTVYCGGLLSKLQSLYYPNYPRSPKRRRFNSSNKVGSSSKMGITVDNQLMNYVEDKKSKKNIMTRNIIDYLENEKKHTILASQLPVKLNKWYKITQADILTIDKKTNDLYMWEIKTGFPVGGYRKRGTFNSPFDHVACTKYNIWQLQRHFTYLGLVENGLNIKGSFILQIYRDKTKGYIVKEIGEAKWIKQKKNVKSRKRKRKE